MSKFTKARADVFFFEHYEVQNAKKYIVVTFWQLKGGALYDMEKMTFKTVFTEERIAVGVVAAFYDFCKVLRCPRPVLVEDLIRKIKSTFPSS